jgi:chromosome segregation ATPase
MGVFSSGDIVIFVLNLLVCVFFYLMGNSKRLEKVKKYGERLMMEMKGLADSAKVPLENFKIDLEVETKAAEQLLFRLKDVRAVIAGYEEALKNIDGRFDQFKELLAGLDRESAAVEENLLRIRDESVFADGVSKKITGARKRFDALEQEIGQFKESMLGSFEKTNAETLEKSVASLLSATKETAAALRDEVEHKVGALAQTADAAAESVKSHLELMRKAKEDQEAVIENSMKEVNRLAEEAVKKAVERSVEYEDQLFQQLREEAGGKAQAAREKIENDWEAVRQMSDQNNAAISAISREIENAKADVRDTISRTSQEEKALWEERLVAAREEFDLFAESATELEGRIKALQEQIGDAVQQIETTFNDSMENAARDAAENAEKFGSEKFNAYQTALEEKFSSFGAVSEERINAAREKIESGLEAVRQLSDENSAAISRINEDIENAKADVRDTISRTSQEEKARWEERLSVARDEFGTFAESATELEGRVKALQEQIGGAAQQIEATFNESMENAARDAAENAEKFGGEKFNAYQTALEEKFSAFGAASEEKLKEVSDTVSGKIGSLNGLVQNTENEISEAVAVMKSGTDKAKTDIELLAVALEALKKDATDNLNGRIAQLEKTMTDSLHEKIEKLNVAQEAEFTKLDSEIGEKYRVAAEETSGKWTGEFERLKEKLDMFENALRLEMDAAGENLGVYKESLEQNMEDLRNNTELALKTEIGKMTLETNERLRSHQREFEDGLKSLSTDVKKRLEGTQASIEENSLKSGEALRLANENMEATAQKIAALNMEIQNAQKEMANFSEQTKLFEQADNLKVELERKIEDMEADIERLTQEKNVLTGMEIQFGKIRRMEEDMNVKLTRFLAEQKRMDIMESNFNRLVKMSGDIEDKLKSISAENDMLEQVQVKLRKLSEAADISEEKYQRVENRNNIIDTTNAGISLNLKKLEDAEHRLEARQADIKNIDKEIAGIKDALAKIKFENGEALEISRALSTLDTSLAEIEGRIEKMETARDWLAGVETRMSELQRNTMENISRIDDKTKKNRDGSRDKVDVLSPSMQEDVRRLKHEGWSVDNIAKNYKLSIGEVQLILEKTQR